MLAVLAACAATAFFPTSAQTTKQSTDLRVGFTQAVDTINPFVTYLASSIQILLLNYDNLVNTRNSDGGPDLPNSIVSSYTVSTDGLTWTFHLRPNLKWSDGVPLTSKDVAWSEEVSIANATQFSSDFDGVKSFKTKGPLTVVAKLAHRNANMLYLTSYILPYHVWKRADPKHLDKFKPPLPLVGSGPYVLTHLDTTGTSVMERNRYFRGTNTGPKRVLIINYGNNDEMAQDLELNRLDWMSSADPPEYRQLARAPGVIVFRSPSARFDYMNFNLSKAVTPGVHTYVVQDAKVREAIQYAMNKQAFVNTAFLGLGQAGKFAILSPYYKRYYTDFSSDPQYAYANSPSKAASILDADGWKLGSDGLRHKNGKALEFTLYDRTVNQPQQAEGKLIKAQLSSVGIKVDLQTVSDDRLNAVEYNTVKDKLTPDYDSVLWDVYGGVNPNSLLNVFTKAQVDSYNDAIYLNPQYDRLYSSQNALTDPVARKKLVTQMQRIILRDNPYIFLSNPDDISAGNSVTWHHWVLLPQPLGQPLSTWSSVTGMIPGTAAVPSYPGVPWVYGAVIAAILVLVGRTLYQRRREQQEPVEVPSETEAGAGAVAT